MEKEQGQVKFTETEDGFRVDVTGKTLKEAFSCGCLPFAAMQDCNDSSCYTPKKETTATMSCCCMPVIKVVQKDNAECCPDNEKK